MDSRTVGRMLLDKVRCIGNLLEQEEQPAHETDFNELVFGTASPPVPSQKELIYWYGFLVDLSDSSFILCLRILVLRWTATGVSESNDLEAWITTLVAFMEVPLQFLNCSNNSILVCQKRSCWPATYMISFSVFMMVCTLNQTWLTTELQAFPGVFARLVAQFESSRSSLLETFLPFKRQNAFFDNLVMIKPSSTVPSEIPSKVWDNIESATLTVSENDGPFSLGLFDARERQREHSLWEPDAIRVGIS